MDKMKGRKIDRDKWNWKDIGGDMQHSKRMSRIIENNEYRQGRTKQQLESSYIGATIAMIGLVILTLLSIIFSI